MKTVSAVQDSPRRQSRWVLTNYDGKDLWKRSVLSLECECVMDDESGEQVEDELESVTSSAKWFMQGWRNETESWFQRWGDVCSLTKS